MQTLGSPVFRGPVLFQRASRTFRSCFDIMEQSYRIGDCVAVHHDGSKHFARIVELFEDDYGKFGVFQWFITPPPSPTNAARREKQLFVTEQMDCLPLSAVICQVSVLSYLQFVHQLHSPQLALHGSDNVFYYRMRFIAGTNELVDLFPEADEIFATSAPIEAESEPSIDDVPILPSLNVSTSLSHFSSSHGVSVPVGPAALQLQLPVKRRRGRPRKIAEPAAEPATIPVFTSLVSDASHSSDAFGSSSFVLDTIPGIPAKRAAPNRRKKMCLDTRKASQPAHLKESRKRKASSVRNGTCKVAKLSAGEFTSPAMATYDEEPPTLQVDVSLTSRGSSGWRLGSIKLEQDESTPTEDEQALLPSPDRCVASSDDDTEEDLFKGQILVSDGKEQFVSLEYSSQDFICGSVFDTSCLLNSSFGSETTCDVATDDPSFMPPLFDEIF